MKKLIVLIALMFIFTLTSFSQTPNDVYKKYKDFDGVTSIIMGEDLFNIVKEFDTQDEVFDNVETLENIIILESEKIKFCEEVDLSEYKEVMVVKEDGETVKIYGKFEGDIVNEMIIFTEDGSYAMIYIKGKIELDKILEN